jgi:hypothetical protein
MRKAKVNAADSILSGTGETPPLATGSFRDPHKANLFTTSFLLTLSIGLCPSADVKRVLRVYSIDVAAHEKDDLNEEKILERLRKVRSHDGV